ncbi:MAG: dTMP kinase [Cyanobacteria bacterium]|nr:dTMP kinase [Cyanobacteriota bacterium]
MPAIPADTSPSSPLNTQGRFITFEGLDGCGKSTQMQLCADALTQQGFDIIQTCNPGGTEIGKALRQTLLHHPGYVSETCELLMYVADRAQHMSEVVLPGLSQGKIVLCDRHVDSSVAYQGYGRGLDLLEIHTLNHIATQGRYPDLTFLFDADPALMRERVTARGAADRLEREQLNFYTRVREGFLHLAQENPERICVLDATQPIEKIHHAVLQALTR